MTTATAAVVFAFAATDSLREFWSFYRQYTHTAAHTAAAAALAIFGLLVFIDPWFAALAIGSYVVPPIVLYVLGDKPDRSAERTSATDGHESADRGAERVVRERDERRGTAEDRFERRGSKAVVASSGAGSRDDERSVRDADSGDGDTDTDADDRDTDSDASNGNTDSNADDSDTDSDSDDGDTDSDSDDADTDSDGDDGDTDSDSIDGDTDSDSDDGDTDSDSDDGDTDSDSIDGDTDSDGDDGDTDSDSDDGDTDSDSDDGDG